ASSSSRSADMLLADIGGTYVRFATLHEDGRIDSIETWLTSLYHDFASAVRAYRDLTGAALPMKAAAVCAAGPLINDAIDMTNCRWNVSLEEIATATGVAHPMLVNDFEAVAQAVPTLAAADLSQVGGGEAMALAPKIAIGAGTGLGVASVVADRHGGWIVAA